MRLSVYCTAVSYNMTQLVKSLQKQLRPVRQRDVVHVSYQSDMPSKDVFYFSYGAFVAWNLSLEEETEIINHLKNYEEKPFKNPEMDTFVFSYGEQFKINHDEIVLTNFSILTKLALSYALAQSEKLNSYETGVQATIEKTKKLPQELFKEGKITLSRKEIVKIIANLFLERNSINLHTDVLDTPEFFWEYPELESIYSTAAKYLDLSTRIDILNKRLNIIQELLKILSSQINEQHSTRLVWILILVLTTAIFIAIIKPLLI